MLCRDELSDRHLEGDGVDVEAGQRVATAAGLSEPRRVVAAQRAEECLASRDAEGVLTWKRIVKAMLELLKDRPGEGERIN